MEKRKITIGKSVCNISNTRIYVGDNEELICLKIYKGDWGDWDEKPEQNNETNDNDPESNMVDPNCNET